MASDVHSELRRREYDLRTVVDRLRREVYDQTDPSASTTLLDELVSAEEALREVEAERIAAEGQDPQSGLILDTTATAAETHRGAETTGLEAKVYLKMAHLPTSFYHLMQVEQTPLLTCSVKATRRLEGGPNKRRVRVRSFIEGYSAEAIDTFEVPIQEEHRFDQLPALFLDRIRDVSELTRAALNVVVEDLDGRVELHVTKPVWLLARTSAPLSVKDPQTGGWQDLTPYLGAFVTPNAPSLMTFLREAERHHPDGRLVGFQGKKEGVPTQVKALYDALKAAEITYINSVITINPEPGMSSQRVRLPRESLADREANCIDGTVLVASLLEGISMNPAIVLIPGHAFVAWETWSDSNEWRYLETTMIGSHTFEEACDSAEKTAKAFAKTGKLRKYPLNDLRSQKGITPME
jgi:hypothetical protein